MNKHIYLLLLILVSLSCNEHQQFPEKDIVMNGGSDKSNYYENMQSYTQPVYEKIASSDTAGCTAPPLCVSSYQTILATRNSSVIKATAYATEWKALLDDSALVSGGMFCDAKQNIYACTNTGGVYSFDKDGKRKWKTAIPLRKGRTIWEDIIPVGSGIVCTNHDGVIYYLDSFTGKSSVIYKSNFAIAGVPIVNTAENIVFAVTTLGESTDSIISCDKNGAKKWRIHFPDFRITTSPVLINNDIVIGGMKKEGDKEIPLIQVMSVEGKILRTFSPDATPRYISGNKKGEVFVVSYNLGIGEPLSMTQCFASNGSLQWQMSFRFPITSPLLVGDDIVCFVAQRGNAIGCYVLNNAGKLIRLIQLDEAPPLFLRAVLNPAGAITLAPLKGGILTKVTAGRSSLFSL